MPDLPAILDTVRRQPDDERHWLALASLLWDNGRHEAAVVRVFWPTIRDDVAGRRALESAMELVRRNAGRLGRRAREIEEMRDSARI